MKIEPKNKYVSCETVCERSRNEWLESHDSKVVTFWNEKFDYFNEISEYYFNFLGKARRLKQAKDEATEEIERYRQEREKQFKEFESKVTE